MHDLKITRYVQILELKIEKQIAMEELLKRFHPSCSRIVLEFCIRLSIALSLIPPITPPS